MLISHLIMRGKTPAPSFAPGLFIALISIFALIGQNSPIMGLTGLGVTLITAGSLIELNRLRIWDNYRKAKRIRSWWTKPNNVYYTINVMFLWPFIIFLGVVCLAAAYILD